MALANTVRVNHRRAFQEAVQSKELLSQTGQQIRLEVSHSPGLPFLSAAIEPVTSVLREMEQNNILPADITSGFVDQVVAHLKSICGREHNDDSRSDWETYRKNPQGGRR